MLSKIAGNHIRPFTVLNWYLMTGEIDTRVRVRNPLFMCPEGFCDSYEAFMEYLRQKELASSTVRNCRETVQQFIQHMISIGVESSEMISPAGILSFLSAFKHFSINSFSYLITGIRQIYIKGGLHGDLRRFQPEIFYEQEGLTKEDIVLVCGDFGCVWHGDERDDEALDWLEARPLFPGQPPMNKRLSCCFCFVFGNIFVGFCEWISAIDFAILALPITERSQKMSENIKNLCAPIPAELHAQLRERQEASGQTLGQYMTELITKFYEQEMKPTMKRNQRTVAFQVSEELFSEFKDYLNRKGIKQNAFFLGCIQRALEEEKQAENGVESE